MPFSSVGDSPTLISVVTNWRWLLSDKLWMSKNWCFVNSNNKFLFFSFVDVANRNTAVRTQKLIFLWLLFLSRVLILSILLCGYNPLANNNNDLWYYEKLRLHTLLNHYVIKETWVCIPAVWDRVSASLSHNMSRISVLVFVLSIS